MMPKKAAHANMEELISHIFIMGRLMRDKLHKNINAGQCSLLEFETMKYVKDVGQPHMRDVAKNFHVTPPAATLLIESLVEAKLLARVLDPKDRRSVRVSLTPKGRKVLERGIAKKVGEMKKIFGALTPAERTQFVSIIKKIIKNNL
jgi:DNA-binding MarR family transcriptional regulator